MDRQTRKQLKTDKFAQEIGQGFSFLTEHRAETKRYGLIGLAVVVVVGGIFFYTRHEAGVRADALEQAQKIDNAIIAAKPTPTNLAFPTQDEKDKARSKAFADLATKYHGSAEGAVGAIFTAAEQADKGNLSGAEKIYQDVVDSAPKEYSALAKISLAHIYAGEGKNADAEKMLRDLVDHPTSLISSEEAKLELADIVALRNPKEALDLISPLRASPRTAISKAALTEYGRISAMAPQS